MFTLFHLHVKHSSTHPTLGPSWGRLSRPYQAMGCSASCKPCKPLCGSAGEDYSVNFGGGEELPAEDADEGEEHPAELDQEKL